MCEALNYLNPGGRSVFHAIRKEEFDQDVLMKLDYPTQLWMEKEIKSIANVTRADVREFLQSASAANIKPEFQEYELKDGNQELVEMKRVKFEGQKFWSFNAKLPEGLNSPTMFFKNPFAKLIRI